MSDEFDNNVIESDEVLYDENVNDTQNTVEEKSWYDKAIDWAKDHKVGAIAGVIGGAVVSTWIGAKAFSKKTVVEVEKLPDPTIMDKYDRVPVEEHTYTDYKEMISAEKPSSSRSIVKTYNTWSNNISLGERFMFLLIFLL